MLRRYRPIKALGGGGFGKTYLAEDVEKFDEICVIKQFAPSIQGTAGLQVATRLFEQEARRLQQLGEHQQIPTLLAYFDQDQRLYLVQQYIEGQNLLDELEQQGTFNEQKIRELLLDLLNILKVVHQQKVIHRDIKPENIIRRRSDGKLVLIDFGASKQLTATATATPGTMIGSFGYVPMEQMQGGEAYPSSDLYSLGATCFHLLAGIAPWELWKTQAYGWVESWRQHLPQPVSQKLGRILDKLLQQDYERRYQSASEVLADLNRQPPAPPKVSTKVVSPPQPSPPQPSVPPTIPVPPTPALSVPAAIPTPQSVKPVPPSKHHKLKRKWVVSSAILLTILGGGWIYSEIQFHGNPISVLTFLFFPFKTTFIGHSNSVLSVAISPDGQTLASGSDDKTIKIWNLSTGQEIRTLTGHSNSVQSVAISPDGQTLASGSGENTKIWNLSTGQEIRTLSEYYGYSAAPVAISPDGQTLASGSDDKTIKIWNLSTGQKIRTLTGHSDSVGSVAISPDGQILASGSDDKTIKIWNLSTGQEIRTLTGHSDAVASVAISPDGQTLASGSDDKTIKIWNLSTGQEIGTLTGHSNSVQSVAISPDGQTLASGSRDKTIKIWNLFTGQKIGTLTEHYDSVQSVAISPDGQTLASGSYESTIKIWRLPK
jgi:WD40 repeat protein